MSEYIDKSKLYGKLAELEDLARRRYLDTPSISPCYERYYAQLSERTALKQLVADFPAENVAEVVGEHLAVQNDVKVDTTKEADLPDEISVTDMYRKIQILELYRLGAL